MATITEVLDRLDGVRATGRGWSAKCPAHDDRHPSLSVTVGYSGRILLYCHAGCALADIVEALGLSLTDLFADSDGERLSYSWRTVSRRLP